MRRLIFLTGDPGAGKSTLARQLAREFGLPYLSTGDVLRQAGHAAQLVDGDFGPDDVVLDAVRQFVAQNEWDCIVDGFPRKAKQVDQAAEIAQAWHDTRMPGQDGDLDWRVIYLTIDPDEAVKRYQRQGFRRSLESGKYGPAGDTCPAGGRYFVDDIHEHYPYRRQKQEPSLRNALTRMIELGIPYTARSA